MANLEVEFVCKVQVPQEDWIDFLIHHPDIFATNYCGYWMRGIEVDGCSGWLCWEHGGDQWARHGHEPNLKEAMSAYLSGGTLPNGYHRLDKAAAIKAYVEGVKRWGVEWMSGRHGDSMGFDVVIQLALLGEVRYG